MKTNDVLSIVYFDENFNIKDIFISNDSVLLNFSVV